MEFFKISEPDYSHIDFSKLYTRYRENRPAVMQYVHSVTYPKYLPWEKARFVPPPAGFTAEESWYMTHDLRSANAQKLPVRTPKGAHFTWTRLNYTDQYLNQFDLYMGGHFLTQQARLSGGEQQSFLTRGVLEEAIASSQLEGASVTRKQAKDMIAENRAPKNKSEWMAYNNYQMMLKITAVYKDAPLSLDLLLEMHRILAAHTMDEADIGRWREDADDVTIGPDLSPLTTFVPPNNDFLMQELPRLITFANTNDSEHFMHPIIKAIVLHFWVAYLHPFVDGNGRMARALFYWLLHKYDYGLATYIPLSTVIKRAPIQYSDAYIYSEQDDNDFTYFYDYHMKKLKVALDDFLEYVEKQRNENKQIDTLLDSYAILNSRQKQIMHYLLSSPHHRVSMTSHATLNKVSIGTALADLKYLQQIGLVFTVPEGRFVYYYAKPLQG
ncbi:MAG: Fic family protein [Candidatus Saccharimonadales bacterium]